MKRPVVLIVGAVAGALIVAAVGASAHTGLFVTKSAGVQSSTSDEAPGASTETPEPAETPEAAETAEDADNDTDEDDDAQGDNDRQGSAATGSGEHDGSRSGSGRKDD